MNIEKTGVNLDSFEQDSSTTGVSVRAESAVFPCCYCRQNRHCCFLFHGIEEEGRQARGKICYRTILCILPLLPPSRLLLLPMMWMMRTVSCYGSFRFVEWKAFGR